MGCNWGPFLTAWSHLQYYFSCEWIIVSYKNPSIMPRCPRNLFAVLCPLVFHWERKPAKHVYSGSQRREGPHPSTPKENSLFEMSFPLTLL